MKKKKKINSNNPNNEALEKEIFEKLSSFFSKCISDGQLIEKEATLFDSTRISYIKGKDLKQFFETNFENIQKEMLSITKTNIGKEANKDSIKKFYHLNHQYHILLPLRRLPGDKAKYPKKLLPLIAEEEENLDFNEANFYLINLKKEKSNKPLIYLGLLIIFIFLIVLFPIWPLNVKLGVLYFLLGCMIFLIVFLLLTIVVTLVGMLFGYDIYIMPNIDEAKMSWKDRLINPFIAINIREDPCWFVVIRIFMIISLIGLGIIAYFFPKIPKASYTMVKNLMVKLFSYGKQKIEDIHYHRNDVTVHERQYLEDLDGF